MPIAESAKRVSEQELQMRMLAVDNAIAQQELEGLTVSAEATEDLRVAARGVISSQEVIENIHARLRHASILQS